MENRDITTLLDTLAGNPAAFHGFTVEERASLNNVFEGLSALGRGPKRSVAARAADGASANGDRAVGDAPLGYREVEREPASDWPFPLPGGRYVANADEAAELVAQYDASDTPRDGQPSWVDQLRAILREGS